MLVVTQKWYKLIKSMILVNVSTRFRINCLRANDSNVTCYVDIEFL